MPNYLRRSWEKIQSRNGHFGHRLVHGRLIARYMVHGFQCQSEGETAWRINVCEPSRNYQNDYWVSGGSFYSMNISSMHNNTDLTIIQMTGPREIHPLEQQAVIAAITEWEIPNQRKRIAR